MALQHQKLVIQIDLDERELHGFTDLTFAQLTADHIYLNARQIKINSIAALLPDENGNERAGSVVDIPDFVYEDTLSRPGDGTIESRPESAEPVKSFSDLDSSYHLQLRRRLLLEKRRVDAQGEVYVPLKSILDLTPQNSDSTNPDDGDGNNNTENEGMAGVEQQQNDAPRILFESLTIRVSFSLISPTVGAYFFDSNSSRTEV